MLSACIPKGFNVLFYVEFLDEEVESCESGQEVGQVSFPEGFDGVGDVVFCGGILVCVLEDFLFDQAW